MRGRRLAIALGSVLVLAGLVTWALWGRLEWSEREVWTGYSGEARFNDFLACQRLLERLGQPTSSIRGLPGSGRGLGRNDVILLPQRLARTTPGQAAALAAWVRRGGLLVAEGFLPESREAGSTQDPLFQAFGARIVQVPEWPGAGPAPGPKLADPKAFDEANRQVRVDLDGRSYQVRLGAWRELLDVGGQAVRTARNASGAKLLRYDVGQGRVILCTELACFSNGLIAENDHAAFLSALVQDWSPDNRAWIVYREEPPSLWGWLRERAGRVLGALAVLIAALLWHTAPRFGPRLPDPQEGRRSLLEHLLACGRFQWSRHSGNALLVATREAAFARIHRAHPSWGHLELQELCTRLSADSGLPEARIARALGTPSFSSPHEFTEAIQTLELIRKKL